MPPDLEETCCLVLCLVGDVPRSGVKVPNLLERKRLQMAIYILSITALRHLKLVTTPASVHLFISLVAGTQTGASHRVSVLVSSLIWSHTRTNVMHVHTSYVNTCSRIICKL
jgi:hypothetical protein